MTIYVRSPGSCGEFIQGSLNGNSFLVTCPINRYSYAMSNVAHPLRNYYISMQNKSRLARLKTLDYLGIKDTNVSVYVRSDVPQGKGMASSSADISAVAMATALAHGQQLTMDELSELALSIEPSDATYFPCIVQFDYLHGKITRPLGECPPMTILIFDEGGAIDTVSFNKRMDLPSLIREKEGLIEEALALFEQGLGTHNITDIGQAVTISSFANQRILPKQPLYEIHEIGQFFNSVGTIIAHSGTIIGLLFPVDVDAKALEGCIKTVRAKLPELTFLDTVETVSEGITFMKR